MSELFKNKKGNAAFQRYLLVNYIPMNISNESHKGHQRKPTRVQGLCRLASQ